VKPWRARSRVCLGFVVPAGGAKITAGPRRERSGKARSAGKVGSRAARRAALKT
jgi:hypothetical protein